jgi:hypothetical protein
MKLLNKLPASLIYGGLLWFGIFARGANLPADWQHEQSFEVPTNGLMKIILPRATLNAARPALEDLRLYDDASSEVPYVIERPLLLAKVVQSAKSFQATLSTSATVIVLETGLKEALNGVTLETPAVSFIKSVQVESSNDGIKWRPLTEGQPVFRQPYGASQLHIALPIGSWRWLRLTVDDQRSPPIPFTSAEICAVASEPAPSELLPVKITERDENPGETRLALELGAANLNVASIQLETTEPLFTRQVTLSVPQISEDSIREQTVGQGVIYRVAVPGQSASENLAMPLENEIRSGELFLLIKNGDSPPLSISSVQVAWRPVYLVFLARQTGNYHLLTGNSHCDAPHYDLAVLNMNLKSIAVLPATIPPVLANPNYRPPDVLPGIEMAGVSLNAASWKYRKLVKVSRGGAQQLELDLDVLAHGQPGFSDLRLLHGTNQVAYIIQHTSINRALALTVTATNDVKNPKLSRWFIELPRAGLPLRRLVCVVSTPVFQRSLTLAEELTDDRGNRYRHELGNATWGQTPDRRAREFSLSLDSLPQSDTLILETENGDNLPIELDKCTAFYPVTRVLFKATPEEELFLYYGNPQVASPSYDLNLVANELLAVDKNAVTLSAEERLGKISGRENQLPGKGGIVLWAVLAVVVVGLLVVISRLLPKPSA